VRKCYVRDAADVMGLLSDKVNFFYRCSERRTYYGTYRRMNACGKTKVFRARFGVKKKHPVVGMIIFWAGRMVTWLYTQRILDCCPIKPIWLINIWAFAVDRFASHEREVTLRHNSGNVVMLLCCFVSLTGHHVVPWPWGSHPMTFSSPFSVLFTSVTLCELWSLR
jgi:hypothetical protein